MNRMQPLDIAQCPDPELKGTLEHFVRTLGFVPNSLLTMQRSPAMVKGFGELTMAVMSEDSGVDLGFMRIIAHFASRAAGCQYCEAHSLVAAKIHGIDQEKLDAHAVTEHAGSFGWGRRQGAGLYVAGHGEPNRRETV